jgi:Mrp family chromosome partitioning ATPase
VLAVSDALKVGSLADEVLMMIDWSTTPRQAVTAAVRAVQRAQIAITGLVMTKVDLRRYARANPGDGYYLSYEKS